MAVHLNDLFIYNLLWNRIKQMGKVAVMSVDHSFYGIFKGQAEIDHL